MQQATPATIRIACNAFGARPSACGDAIGFAVSTASAAGGGRRS
jgi:hypothetical protein